MFLIGHCSLTMYLTNRDELCKLTFQTQAIPKYYKLSSSMAYDLIFQKFIKLALKYFLHFFLYPNNLIFQIFRCWLMTSLSHSLKKFRRGSGRFLLGFFINKIVTIQIDFIVTLLFFLLLIYKYLTLKIWKIKGH